MAIFGLIKAFFEDDERPCEVDFSSLEGPLTTWILKYMGY